MNDFIITEAHLYRLRKNEEFGIVDAVVKFAIKRAKEKIEGGKDH